MCIFPLKSHLKAASLLFGRSAKNKVHPLWLAPSPIEGKCAALPVCLDIVWGWSTPARVSNCTVTALEVQNMAICECCQKALAVRTKSISLLSYSFGLVLSFTSWFYFKDKMLPAKLLLREVNFLCCADISKGLEHCCQMNCLNEKKLQLQNSASKLWPDRIDNWGSRNITKYFIFLKVMNGCAVDSDDVLLLLSLTSSRSLLFSLSPGFIWSVRWPTPVWRVVTQYTDLLPLPFTVRK